MSGRTVGVARWSSAGATSAERAALTRSSARRRTHAHTRPICSILTCVCVCVLARLPLSYCVSRASSRHRHEGSESVRPRAGQQLGGDSLRLLLAAEIRTGKLLPKQRGVRRRHHRRRRRGVGTLRLGNADALGDEQPRQAVQGSATSDQGEGGGQAGASASGANRGSCSRSEVCCFSACVFSSSTRQACRPFFAIATVFSNLSDARRAIDPTLTTSMMDVAGTVSDLIAGGTLSATVSEWPTTSSVGFSPSIR